MPWVVAEFFPHRGYKRRTVHTIPAGWLQNLGHTLISRYPPEGTPYADIRDMIMHEVEVGDGWDKLPVNYVSRHYDNFITATSVEMSAVCNVDSDLERYFHMYETGEECTRCRSRGVAEEVSIIVPPKPPAIVSRLPVSFRPLRVIKPKAVTIPQKKGIGSAKAQGTMSMLKPTGPSLTSILKPSSVRPVARKTQGATAPSMGSKLTVSPLPSILKLVVLPTGTRKEHGSTTHSPEVISRPSWHITEGAMPTTQPFAEASGPNTLGLLRCSHEVKSPQSCEQSEDNFPSATAFSSQVGEKAVVIHGREMQDQVFLSSTAHSTPLGDLESLNAGSGPALETADPPAASVVTELKAFIEEKARVQEKKLDMLERELKAQSVNISLQMSEKLDTLIYMIRNIKINTPLNVEQDLGLEALHSLPMERFNEMAEFELTISSHPNYRGFMVKYLHERTTNLLCRELSERMYATAVNKTVYEICAMLITNELARGMCLKKRTLYKHCMEDSYPQFIELVFETVKSKSMAGRPVDLVTVKRSIGEWLRQSRLRARRDMPAPTEELGDEEEY